VTALPKVLPEFNWTQVFQSVLAFSPLAPKLRQSLEQAFRAQRKTKALRQFKLPFTCFHFVRSYS
jgi:hypothetical protein